MSIVQSLLKNWDNLVILKQNLDFNVLLLVFRQDIRAVYPELVHLILTDLPLDSVADNDIPFVKNLLEIDGVFITFVKRFAISTILKPSLSLKVFCVRTK